MLEWPDWSEVKPGEWHWKHFSPAEMACHGTRALKVNPLFMDRLEELREQVGPLVVSSGYRTLEYDATIGGKQVHPSGSAVDLRVAGQVAFDVLFHATRLGFLGIGLNQKGSWERRFIHLDTLVSENHPRPRVWTY